jgi:hypothetical protein
VEDADERALRRHRPEVAAVEAMASLAGAIEGGEQGSLGELELDPRGLAAECDQVAGGAAAEAVRGEAEVDGLDQIRLPGAVRAPEDDDPVGERNPRVGEVAEPLALDRADHEVT